jgi:excisionase family DNA binding protein
MLKYSTRQAAERLGLSLITLQRHIANKKIPAPPVTRVGAGKLRIWTELDIEKARRVLPSIKNGRKTRYQKQRRKAKKNNP